MNKQEFLGKLQNGLSGLPKDDIEARLSFYSEMIDDRMEEGMTEEEAVAGIGTVDSVISQIISETPLPKLITERVKLKRSLRAWEIILIILGSPIWLSLAIAAAAVILSLYAVLWSFVVSLWAVTASLAFTSVYHLIVLISCLVSQSWLGAMNASGLLFLNIGLCILIFIASLKASKGIVKLTKVIALKIKSFFVGKETSK
ncbi:MAG: DUF1700 domain-containing protein [Clostridia bacterium]|nr:DUF1700 domain-containing protein [Clostridia bacterium]